MEKEKDDPIVTRLRRDWNVSSLFLQGTAFYLIYDNWELILENIKKIF